MGDRVLIQLRQGSEVSPVLYVHWGGKEAFYLIRKTERRMKGRRDDLVYSFARLVGTAHEATPGNLSLGVWNAPIRGEAPKSFELGAIDEGDSHGDAGCLVVDVFASGWVVTPIGGRYARDPESVEMAEREARVRLDAEGN